MGGQSHLPSCRFRDWGPLAVLEVKGREAGAPPPHPPGPRPPPAGAPPTSRPLSAAQSEADLKPVHQDPHGVPDPGSAGRHHDFGSFGGNCKGGKGRVRGLCVCAGERGLSKERRGGGTEEKAPIQCAHSHAVPEPRLRTGDLMAPRTHPLPGGVHSQCGQKTSASRCDMGSDQRRRGKGSRG